MVSVTSICNRALSQIGARSTIASLTEDTNEANQCNLLYADTRDEVLQMSRWNFATKTATLALLKSAPGTPSNPAGATEWSSAYPAPPWLYEYGYPSDCLQVQMLIPQINTGIIGVPLMSNSVGMYPYVIGPAARFVTATDTDTTGAQINVILTNQYQAIGKYTMRVTNPTLWSASFVQALVCALSAKLCPPINGNASMMNAMFKAANDAIISARASDANEGLEVIDNVPDWIRCRDVDTNAQGYGYWVTPYSSLYTVY